MKRILCLTMMVAAFASCKKDNSEKLVRADLIGKWRVAEHAAIYSSDPGWKAYPVGIDAFFHINEDSTFYYSCGPNVQCNTISGRYKIIPSGKSAVVLMVRTMNTNISTPITDTLFIEKLSAVEFKEDRAVRVEKSAYESYKYQKQ